LRDEIIPALAIDTVCCSMTSCKIVRVFSDILSNSSIQHIPPSESTNAPLQNEIKRNKHDTRTFLKLTDQIHCHVRYRQSNQQLKSLFRMCIYRAVPTCAHTYTISLQKVDTCKSWDLLTPGSPAKRMLMSPRKRLVADLRKVLLTPPKS
jgi:hypothetical protein